jgi:hypothetical protein
MTAIADQLRALLARMNPPPNVATLSYIIWAQTRAIAAQVEVRLDGHRPLAEAENYPDISFHREAVSGADLSDAILTRLTQVMGTLQSSQVNPRGPTGRGGWPAASIVLTYGGSHQAGHVQSDALLAFGARPQMSASTAIASWFEGEQPYLGSCRILIEDPRGRIGRIEHDDQMLRVVAQRHTGEEALEIHVAILSSGRQQLAGQRQKVSDEAPCSFALPRGATDAKIFLLNQANEILDKREVTLPWVPLSDEALQDRGSQAAKDLANGEREEVEFKPWVRDDKDGERKKAEIIKTIVAFGNEDHTCRLYIGVTDEGEPEGKGAMYKALKTMGTEAPATPALREQQLRRWLSKLLDTRIQHPPTVDVRLIEVAGEPLLSVLVDRAGSGPCATLDNKIFVRRGATSGAPDLEHLRRLFQNDTLTMNRYLVGLG